MTVQQLQQQQAAISALLQQQQAAQVAATQKHVLNNAFILIGIVFRFVKHPFPYYHYVLSMLNAIYCGSPIEKHELVPAGSFIDQGFTSISTDIIYHFKSQFIAHASTIYTSDTSFLTQVISSIPLSSAQKNGGNWTMTTIKHFEQALDVYQGPMNLCPPDIASSNYFIVYFNTAYLYLDCNKEIDCLD